MIIQLKKFGTTLVSRQMGKEAFLAFSPSLNAAKEKEAVRVDFEGVNTFSPSWGDEFLTPLHEKFGDNLILLPTENPSVKMTVEMLEEINNIKFRNK
ncbi:MAG: DUF4325 domain-containing protein [Patescibacteria group bacterium]|nr:DUF4325 domain-containing protein [Patescibacteria group bacterium]